MHVDHDTARAACLDGLTTFVGVVDQLDDNQLLADSRCRGWVVGDVVVHVHLALQEMLHGLVSPTDDQPDTDAASYWRAELPTNDAEADDIDQLRFARILFSAYRRPTGVLGNLRPTAAAVQIAIGSLQPGAVHFQSRILSTGDFLATWATELAVHHLDLTGELDLPGPARSALSVARQTVEALAGEPLPDRWDDAYAVLVGTGRMRPDPADQLTPSLVGRLPVLG